MIIRQELDLEEKLAILTDAAKYDVACTSSGVDRHGQRGSLGNAASCGICHSFSADGRCISLLKILMTNCCIYDCRYCVNRVSNDNVRTFFTPEEICQLTMEFYRRNYIEGLFLSSGILNSPDETMARIVQALTLLRNKHNFRGYIHVKAIPGADPELIRQAGLLADRMSINLELPTGDGLRKLAPAKTREKILTPMRQIQRGIASNQLQLAEERKSHSSRTHRSLSVNHSSLAPSVRSSEKPASMSKVPSALRAGNMTPIPGKSRVCLPDTRESFPEGASFVPAGQSTQMIIGATDENDRQILSVTEALYQNFQLKRVFFSAYTAVNEDSRLPSPETPPPLLREHRLYQADWLLRYYHFQADELLSDDHPWFNLAMDPKCDWAIRHPELFPVEVMSADSDTLLRVPGIGVRSVRRILRARRYGALDYASLKKFGVVMKRAAYFITCCGRKYVDQFPEPETLARMLSADEHKSLGALTSDNSYRQLSLFDDFHLSEDSGLLVKGIRP